jgi:hypothetical protein
MPFLEGVSEVRTRIASPKRTGFIDTNDQQTNELLRKAMWRNYLRKDAFALVDALLGALTKSSGLRNADLLSINDLGHTCVRSSAVRAEALQSQGLHSPDRQWFCRIQTAKDGD